MQRSYVAYNAIYQSAPTIPSPRPLNTDRLGANFMCENQPMCFVSKYRVEIHPLNKKRRGAFSVPFYIDDPRFDLRVAGHPINFE